MKFAQFMLIAAAATAVGWFIGCLAFCITLGRLVFTEAFND